MVIYDKNGVPAVFKWGDNWYEPLVPTGVHQWLKDNPELKDRIKWRDEDKYGKQGS